MSGIPENRKLRTRTTFVVGLGVGIVCFFLAESTMATATKTGRDLTGIVRNQKNQLVSNASVFIYTAGPRHGIGIVCPSCYADCAKNTKSDFLGRFRIESLDTNLLFQVLVVAPGYAHRFFNRVDPSKGTFAATIQERALTNAPSSQVILGRVLGTDKKPLPNATISINYTTTGNTSSSRPPPGADPLTVTDEHGDFSLASPVKFDSMALQVEARGFARGNFSEVVPGTKRHQFVLASGASLTGRVLFQGRPLRGITVGVAGADRAMGQYVGNFEVDTMEDGQFLFTNLPPNRKYNLYGCVGSLERCGSLPSRIVEVKGDDSQMDAGDLVVVPGHALEGQVKLADGTSIPEHSRLMISRPEAWDWLATELPSDGRFAFTNLPSEKLAVNVRIEGYRLSDRNFSLDPLNGFQLVGRLDSEKTNLTMLLERGTDLPADYSAEPDNERPENLPLGGIETKRVASNALTLAGQVLDADTGAPIQRFRITPGLRRYPTLRGMIEWYRNKGLDGTNGTFSLDVPLKEGVIILMAEADGYVPTLSDALSAERRKTRITLRKGQGPQGIVLLRDGTPAAGVRTYYLGAGEQASLHEDGTVWQAASFSIPGRSKSITDSTGKFQFVPKIGDGLVFAVCSNGFVRCSAGELATNGVLTLQPWSRVRGQLVQNGKPVAGENVDLGWSDGYVPDRPMLGLHGTRTDDDGRFTLENVPPGELQITTRVPVPAPNSGWTNQSQRKFVVKPGEDLDLGDVEKTEPKGRWPFSHQ